MLIMVLLFIRIMMRCLIRLIFTTLSFQSILILLVDLLIRGASESLGYVLIILKHGVLGYRQKSIYIIL